MDTSTQITRSDRTGIQRQVRLPHTSYPVALNGSDPPDETSVQRCGGTNYRGSDIRDLCPPHAHLPHGSANLSQRPSGISASLLDSPDGHGHFVLTDHNDPGQETNTPYPCPVQTGVSPQSRPAFTPQATVVRITQGRTAIAPDAKFRPIFWTQRTFYFRGKKTPPTHHGQAAQRSQDKCITQNSTADLSPSNGTFAIFGQIAMIVNGLGLPPTPPFGLHSLFVHTPYHLTAHTAPMMHRSHILATMSYSGCLFRLSPNGNLHHLRWA